MRKVLLLVSTVAVAALAYFGTLLATAAGPPADLPESLPASELAKDGIPDERRIELQDHLIGEVTERYGLTAESYSNARVLLRTERGPMYVIPGEKGVCLALADSVGCADLPSPEPLVVALLVPGVDNAKYEIGGGLLRADAGNVLIEHSGGPKARATRITGGFAVTPSDGVEKDDAITVSPR